MTVRYRSLITDNARWDGFEFRASDIVISTPPKCGTTWTQMLCALLIFDGPEFPGPLGEISPWLDQTVRNLDEVRALYRDQTHRRFIKTHTPLDGIPIRDDVTYLVVGRDPRDLMVSMEHHWANMDLERVLALRDQAVGNDDLDSLPVRPPPSDDPVERFHEYVRQTEYTGAVNLRGVLHHFDTAWERRDAGNVAMFHYADYRADLPGELYRLARALDLSVTETRARELAEEASLSRMRARADDIAPNAGAIWKDTAAFFRSGGSGEWRARVTDADLDEYDAVVSATVDPDLARWVHHGRIASGIEPGG